MANNEWRTPPEIFEPLNDEFHFNLDAAATAKNALCNYYYTKDGLYFGSALAGGEGALDTPAWPKGEPGGRYNIWCNPPYEGAIVSKFVEKCAEHAKAGGLAVMLLNASTTSTHWYHRFIWDCKMHRPRERVEVRFLPKRVCFLDEAGVPQKSPRYSNMIVIFHPWDVTP